MSKEWTKLNSDNAKSARYDPSSMMLEIEFKSGWIYSYENVPQFVYDGLIASQKHSVTRFISTVIAGWYKFTKRMVDS